MGKQNTKAWFNIWSPIYSKHAPISMIDFSNENQLSLRLVDIQKSKM